MPSDKIGALLSFIIAKFLFTVIIGLLFFGYNIGSVGEDDITILYNNLYQNTGTIENNTGHHSADISIMSGNYTNDTFDSLCNEYKEYCNIIDVTKISDIKKSQEYKIITIITLSKIGYFFSKKYNLESILHTIQIKDEKGTQRGYANHNNIFINIDNLTPTEYSQVLIHELGHIVDLGMIEGTQKEQNKEFTEFNKPAFSRDDISILFYQLSRNNETERKITAKKQDFCSVYGMSNPFEDFAECFHLYINHYDYFTKIEKSSNILHQKYSIIAKILDSNHLDSISPSPSNTSLQYRYRDTTRMK